jgi:hypothetical protein
VIGKRRVPSFLQNLEHYLLDKSIQHSRHSEFSHPTAVRLVDLDPFDRLWSVGSIQ